MPLSSIQISNTAQGEQIGPCTDIDIFHYSCECACVCAGERGRCKDKVSLNDEGGFGGLSRDCERGERQNTHEGDRE